MMYCVFESCWELLKSSHHKKKTCNYVWWPRELDLLWGSFVMYISIESPCCWPETNIMLYVNYTSTKLIFKKDFAVVTLFILTVERITHNGPQCRVKLETTEEHFTCRAGFGWLMTEINEWKWRWWKTKLHLIFY